MSTINVTINKGSNYDPKGFKLKSWVIGNSMNIDTLKIIDNGPQGTILNADFLFMGSDHMTSIDLSEAHFESVTSANSMFYWCNNLVTVSNFNTVNITDMAHLYFMCRNLVNVPNFDTSNVVNMVFMFNGCINITNIPNFDTSNVNKMGSMFGNCYNLTTVPNFNTGKVTSMYSMFTNCNNLTVVPNFNTSKVTDMSDMFTICTKLTDIPDFDTSNVTNMARTFSGCTNLINPPNFNTSKVNNMVNAFHGCSNLRYVPLYDYSNVTNMAYAFTYCTKAVPSDYLFLNTVNVTNMIGIFGNCSSIVKSPNLDTSNVSVFATAFMNCFNLRNVISYNCDNMVSIWSAFGRYDFNIMNITNFGPLVNLGKSFNSVINSATTTLDLHGIRPTTVPEVATDVFNSATSSLVNLTELGKNSQQILIQSGVYGALPLSKISELGDMGWTLVSISSVCLSGDTKIQTEEGLKEIKDIKIGDRIYTYNEETKRQNITEVTKAVNHKNLQNYIFTLANGEQFKCTARHQFLIKSNHFEVIDEETFDISRVSKTDYMEARLIDITDKFITKSGVEISISNIKIENNEIDVYEINTEKGDNYMMGEDYIIVKQEVIEV